MSNQVLLLYTTLRPIQCFFNVDNREFLLYSNSSDINLGSRYMLE